jgi:hypothetical protein
MVLGNKIDVDGGNSRVVSARSGRQSRYGCHSYEPPLMQHGNAAKPSFATNAGIEEES